MSDQTIQQAISDLSMIRQSIERHRAGSPSSSTIRNVLDANLILQISALIFVIGLIIGEYAFGHLISEGLVLSQSYRQMAIFGIVEIGLALSLMVMIAYFVVWRASRHAEQSLTEFLTRNFSYLHRLSFVGDLLVKFAVVSLIVLSGKAAWITPVLVLFTGDYLIQGRFFTIPLKWSLALGLLCFALSAVLYFGEIYLVIYALWIFLAVSIISLIGILPNRLSLQAAGTVSEEE